MKQTPEQMAEYLKARGSSIRSIRRQIAGEIAWRRLQSKKIESAISVGDEEVKAVIDKLNASKGAEEFRVGEIFISANSANEAAGPGQRQQDLRALQQGGSFVGYARQFSEASTAAVGGDLGWVRPEQLPDALAHGVRQMRPGHGLAPDQGPGRLFDRRRAGHPQDPDRRSAQRRAQPEAGVGQLSRRARPAQQAEPIVARFAAGGAEHRRLRRCGTHRRRSSTAKSSSRTRCKMRDLPPALQEMMLPMQVGQATRPFGSIEEGVRVLVLCGRDEVDPSAPSFDQVYAQLNEERINMRSRRYLRDLRRDAVIDFR